MRSSRRFPMRLARWTSLFLLITLVLSFLIITPIRFGNSSTVHAQGTSPNGGGSRVAAAAGVLGPPEANLPNLDEVRSRNYAPPQAPLALPSSDRPPRIPLEPRNGKRVGDPGTTIARDQKPGVRDQNSDGSKRSAALPPDVRKGSAFPTENSRNHRGSASTSRFNHGRSPLRAVRDAALSPPPPIGDDQYVQTLFQNSLARQPNATEQAYWDDILRVAYAHGNGSIVTAARELGKTLFESSDYAARSRSDHWYVYDLYETYLLRGPDTGGWAYWEGMVPWQGREAIRRAFDECGEFINDVGTVTPNGSASSAVSSLSSARADLTNQTGNQLLTRDCEWGVSLLSLPGRSGLDLGLGLSYSSEIWTRSGPYIYFDEDNGWPSPGFRLGFPTVQEKYFDAQGGVNVYLLITPSGHRVELREVGTSNVYEAADSSYLQLTDNGSTLLVRDTSGTQMTYSKYLHEEWHCTQIKDRNGNYLSVNYDWMGHITSITDTLNRTITFNYDTNANLTSITQTWTVNGQQQTHTWVTLGWTSLTMASSYSGVNVSDTYNGEVIPAITMVGFDDGTYVKFQYNGGLQATHITSYASDSNPTTDNHPRSYTAYDYDNSTSDCPRINDSKVWAENWNGINGVPSEVVTQFSVPGDGSHQMITPDGTIYKEFYGTLWQKGLVTQSQVWSGGIEQKWTIPTYTQDDINVPYQTNPRVTETNVYDVAGNRRRTHIDYTTSFGLPFVIAEYKADAATVERFTVNNYRFDDAYVSRRIIGLKDNTWVFDGNWTPYSVVNYGYDGSADLQALPGGANATQHDYTNYGASFVTGRGNLTTIKRMDATDPNNTAKGLQYETVYNVTGSIVKVIDPLTHQSSISYADSFSDSVNRNSFAYPTTATDADGFSSYIQYNYDFGAKTRAQGPPPTNPATGQPYSQWAAQRIYYDAAQRVERVTNEFNGAYKRYVYGPTQIEQYSSVNNVADEAYSNQHFDGLGRVIAAASIHSVSTYSGQVTVYDQMGRAVLQSNPTEVAANWMPTGDDGAPAVNVALAVNGSVATAQNYTQDGVYPGMHFQPSYAIDGLRHTTSDGGNFWRDEHGLPSWLEVDFNGSKTIGEIDVVTSQSYPDYTTGNDPTATQTFNQQGAAAYNVQYWNGSAWTTVPGGSVTNNSLVWKKFSFANITTSKIRVVVNGSSDGVARIVELEAWTPGVHDGGGGWYYSQQSYDWKGRPLITTNTDGTQKSASYSACGCAGSEVTTLTDEMGRRQKIYSDPLGRTAKTEVLNWNGSVYSTTSNSYNARDQVTLMRQYAGSDQSATYQDTSMTFDGYGRLQARHVPEQNTGTATVYAYNPDDTMQSVIDARGASATYSYNNRHLVTGITYSAPAGIPAASNVSFSYDAAGNRTSMTDGFGVKTYGYDQLSRLTSESRPFGNLGPFALSYQYNLADELTKITDATNMSINYGYDSMGRVTGVTGSDNLYAGVSNYASNFQYRAWNGLKAMTDGIGYISSFQYNARLEPTQFQVSGNTVTQNYDYNNDGRIGFVHNVSDANFDRSYSYDHLGRLGQATTGATARGESSGSTPYDETFAFDAFNNLTARESSTWSQDPLSDGSTYTNNRRGDFGYDADGRNSTIGTRNYTFDADGQMTLMTGQKWVVTHYVNVSQAEGYDGDGVRVNETISGQTKYYLQSSLLDDLIIEEIDSSGQKGMGYVYLPDGQLIASQGTSTQGPQVAWKHDTPAGTGRYQTYSNTSFVSRVELDPVGADIGLQAPNVPDTGGNLGDISANHFGGILESRWASFFDPSGGCSSSTGVSASCSKVMSPDGYMNAQIRAFYGDRWYDLPGNHNERELQEGKYVRDVQRIFAESRKVKPKTAPTLKPFNDLRNPYRPFDPDVEEPVFSNDAPQIAGQRVPLSGDQAKAYKDAKNAAEAGLKNAECQKFLREHGIDPKEIASALKRLKAYDGTKSTLSIADAGLYPYGEPDSKVAVRDHFNNPDLEIYAETAVVGGEKTRYDVYFGTHPIGSSTVLLEAMHSATTLDDYDLAFGTKKFNLNPIANETPSQQITDALKTHNCGG